MVLLILVSAPAQERVSLNKQLVDRFFSWSGTPINYL